MNSHEKKRFISGTIFFAVIVAVLQYIFPTANTGTPLKFALYIAIVTSIYAGIMYWLLTRKKKKQQTGTDSDDASS